VLATNVACKVCAVSTKEDPWRDARHDNTSTKGECQGATVSVEVFEGEVQCMREVLGPKVHLPSEDAQQSVVHDDTSIEGGCLGVLVRLEMFNCGVQSVGKVEADDAVPEEPRMHVGAASEDTWASECARMATNM
jgi:hypothetical protein